MIEGASGWLIVLAAVLVGLLAVTVTRPRGVFSQLGSVLLIGGALAAWLWGGGAALRSLFGLSPKAAVVTTLVGTPVVLVVVGLAVVMGRVVYEQDQLLKAMWRGDYAAALRLCEGLSAAGPMFRALPYRIRLDAGEDPGAVLADLEAEHGAVADLDPCEPALANAIGWIRLTQGQPADALAWFTRATEAGWRTTDGQIAVALATRRVDRGVLAMATDAIHATTPLAYRLSGGDVRLGSTARRARVHALLGSREAAEADIAWVLGHLPPQKHGLVGFSAWQVGQALTELGEDERAREVFTKGTSDPGRYGQHCREALGLGAAPRGPPAT